MTVYYEAGLKVLAMASGFRAETLKSVANASNFKRNPCISHAGMGDIL